jgi:hypothetical protein
MPSALKINGNDMVLSVRSNFLTIEEAATRYRHNTREAKHAAKIKYLRSDSSYNRYFVLSEFNNNDNMREVNIKQDENFNDKGYIDSILNEWLEKFKKDYESQVYINKRGKVVRKGWRNDMVPFSEIVISFGTNRPKAPKEGLNKAEVNFINAHVSIERVIRFVNAYCAKYNVKCLLIAEHADEKTKHYQIIFTNYNFDMHKNLRFAGKAETAKFGSFLQDLGAQSFGGIALRGAKGSKAKHLDLWAMHQVEKEFKSKQEREKNIKKLVAQRVLGYATKRDTLFGNEYYRLETENVSKLISEITTIVLEETKQKINIISETDLQTQIDELTRQLVDKGKIIEENGKITKENWKLRGKNKALNELNDAFRDKDIVINLQNRVEDLEFKLGQRDTTIYNMQNKISYGNEVVQKAKNSIQELERLRNIEIQNEAIRAQNENLKSRLENYKHQNSEIDLLKSQKEILSKSLKQALEDKQALEKSKEAISQDNDALRQENSTLKAFKDKVISFFKRFVDKIPAIKIFIEDEVSEIKKDVSREKDMSMGII